MTDNLMISKQGFSSFMLAICCCFWTANFAFAEKAAEVSKQSPVGKQVKDFSLKDFRGKRYSLSDYQDQSIIVLAFLGTECPLVKQYGSRLTHLAEKYKSQQVTIIGINSNVQDSITEIAGFARKHNVEFPILKDVGNQVADELGAIRTPEVFVLDKNRVIQYWGRIDDQYGVGTVRDEPSQKYLDDAIAQLLAGEKVNVSSAASVGCYIGRVFDADPNATVTYSNQISRILQKRCVECHQPGEIAPFSLTEYDEVVGWSEMIREVVRDRRMPPWHASPKHGKFANDRALTSDEKKLIEEWVASGAPQGDPKELPKPIPVKQGWHFDQEPDLVVEIRNGKNEAFKIPATGTLNYQWAFVDPKFTEDKWMQGAQILPGNRAIVHHILCFATANGSRVREQEGYLVGYVPGLRARPFPTGMAKRIPKGSKLAFQIHYTPIGTEQEDLSKIGFLFTDAENVTHEVSTVSAVQPRLRIQPEKANQEFSALSRPASESMQLLGLMPHMHLRGQSFQYQLLKSGSSTGEILLDVPHYDFNWQTAYRLEKPLTLERGDRLKVNAKFNNSTSNLNLTNEDIQKTVTWGKQTWDEMLIGYFDIAKPISPKEVASSEEPANELKAIPESIRRALNNPQGLIAKLDKNKDGVINKDEVQGAGLLVFQRVDRDKDGKVTLEELTAVQRLLKAN